MTDTNKETTKMNTNTNTTSTNPDDVPTAEERKQTRALFADELERNSDYSLHYFEDGRSLLHPTLSRLRAVTGHGIVDHEEVFCVHTEDLGGPVPTPRWLIAAHTYCTNYVSLLTAERALRPLGWSVWLSQTGSWYWPSRTWLVVLMPQADEHLYAEALTAGGLHSLAALAAR